MSDPVQNYTPGRMETFLLRLGTAGELLALMARGGRWWMIPLAVMLLGVAALLLMLQGMQYVAPFIYMVF